MKLLKKVNAETVFQSQWKDVKSKILFDDKNKQDFVVPIRDTYMDINGAICSANDSIALVPNEWALSQLCSRVGIPPMYGRKCFEENPQMIAEHVNYWIDQDKLPTGEIKEKSWLLRAKNDTCRAVLSDKYSTLDNAFVYKALDEGLKGTNAQLKEFQLSDRYFLLRLTFPNLTANIGTAKNKDDVMVGIVVANSEVGASAIKVQTCLYRLVCSNGLIVAINNDTLMWQRHIHLTENEIHRRLLVAIGEALEQGDRLIDVFAKSKEISIPNPLEIIEQLAQKQKYSQEFTDNIKNSYNSEPGNNVFSIVNALTDASKILPLDKRFDVESFAGEWMQKMVS